MILENIGRKIINEDKNLSIRKSKIISEQSFNNNSIINVDIQPEYENFISFDIFGWVNFINENASSNKIVFLYNGKDTLGMIDENMYRQWLAELGVDEDVLDTSTFYDKGYAFFRYCMDSGIDDENVADLVRFMDKHNITDSRDINEDMWNLYMKETNHDQNDVRGLLENASDCIHIPDLMDFLSDYDNIVLTGGGINECLKEVEIGLMALNKNYNTISHFTY